MRIHEVVIASNKRQVDYGRTLERLQDGRALADGIDRRGDLSGVRIRHGVASLDDLTVTADGTTAVIDLTGHGGGTIRLENADAGDLDAEDFVFQEPLVEPDVDGI